MSLLPRRPVRAAFAVLALSGTVLLGACGGSDSGSTSSGESSSTTTRNQDQNQQNQNQQNQNQQDQNQQNQNQQNQNQQNQNQQNQNQQNQNQQQDPTPAYPTIAIVQCRISGTSGSLTVTASSAASGGNRGVTSVHVLTYNDEGASVRTDLTWLGPDTGNGDQWSTARVAFGTGYEDEMTIVAKASSGATKSADFSGSGTPCP